MCIVLYFSDKVICCSPFILIKIDLILKTTHGRLAYKNNQPRVRLK